VAQRSVLEIQRQAFTAVYNYFALVAVVSILHRRCAAYSTLVLKPSFSQSFSIHIHLSLAQADLEFDHSVIGIH